MRVACFLAILFTASASAAPVERELYFVATVDAEQSWKKNDPNHPREQWSKGSAKQRYEVRMRLRSDGKLEVRNLLDPDLQARMEAKTIHLARQARKILDKPGLPFKLPKNDQEKSDLTLRMRRDIDVCKNEPTCFQEKQLYWATIFTAIDTQDPAKPMWQETIFVPRPEGLTVYTENGRSRREQQSQPIITAAADWIGEVLRHAPASGSASADLPLRLPLNQNATWLGLWTGTAHVKLEWSFKEIPAAPVPAASTRAKTQ